MTRTNLSAADLTELDEGDELTIEYGSTNGESGEYKEFEASVHSSDIENTAGFLFGTLTLKREDDDIPRRRLEVQAGDLELEARRTTENGAVWARISRPTTVTVQQ